MIFVCQQAATVRDPDIHQGANIDTDMAVGSKPYVVLTHAPIPMDIHPEIFIDGVVVMNDSFGAIGSGADFEYKRISATQTILVKNLIGPVTIKFFVPNPDGSLPIGQAMVEESLVIQ